MTCIMLTISQQNQLNMIMVYVKIIKKKPFVSYDITIRFIETCQRFQTRSYRSGQVGEKLQKAYKL